MFKGLLLVPFFHPKTPYWALAGDDSWISTSSPLYFYCILKESLVLTSRNDSPVVLNSDLLPSGYHLVKGVPIHKGLLRAIPHSLSPSWLKHLCHMSNPKSTARPIPFILPPAASPFPLQLLVRYTMRADLLKCKQPRCADAWRGLLQDAYRMRPTDLSLVEKSRSASSCHRSAVSAFSGAQSQVLSFTHWLAWRLPWGHLSAHPTHLVRVDALPAVSAKHRCLQDPARS